MIKEWFFNSIFKRKIMANITISETPTINMERLEKMRKEMKDETTILLKKDIIELPSLNDLSNLLVKYYTCVRARAAAIVDAQKGVR